MVKKIISFFILIALLLAGAIFYFRHQMIYSTGSLNLEKTFEIKKGWGNQEVAEKLLSEGIIANKWYLLYYLKTRELSGKIMPGGYQLSGRMTIPEIARIITNPEEKFLRLTFPEGWDARKIAAELDENGLPGEEFLRLVENPGDFKKRYSYLSSEEVKTLEGYLFPDTYFFKENISAQNILGRLVDNFDEKFTSSMREKAAAEGKTLREIIIMASIVEREVQTSEDMKIAAGIFWKRLAGGQRLQSDATLSYFLNDKEDQHQGKDLEIDTPYNSYRYQGLPPGPVSNPGMSALEAALYPKDSPYNYFLTVEAGGVKKVIYSETFEDHVANRNKYGI